MKRVISTAAVCLIITFAFSFTGCRRISTTSSSGLPQNSAVSYKQRDYTVKYVYDDADVLDKMKYERTLDEKIIFCREKSYADFDIRVATLQSLQGTKADDYGKKIRDDQKLSDSCVIFILETSTGKCYIYTSGSAAPFYADDIKKSITDEANPLLKEKKYYNACISFLKYTNRKLLRMFVTDSANVLNDENEEKPLTTKIDLCMKESGRKFNIRVATVKTLQDSSYEDYCSQLVKDQQLGDNTAIFLIETLNKNIYLYTTGEGDSFYTPDLKATIIGTAEELAVSGEYYEASLEFLRQTLDKLGVVDETTAQ